MDIDLTPIRLRWEALSPNLSEREKRLFVAAEAKAAGNGGVGAVSLATGVARSTIGRGLKDLAEGLHGIVGKARCVAPEANANRYALKASITWVGVAARICRILQVCFLAVETTDRSLAKI